MQKNELVAPCGLNCGICPVYLASDNPTLAKSIAEHNSVSLEEANCKGCNGEKGCIKINGGQVCETYDCVKNQKKLEFCFQCTDFPCSKLAPCADRAKFIPHNMKIFNLLLIRKMGVEKWLEESNRITKQYFKGKKPRGGDEIQL